MADFKKAIPVILHHEGGYQDGAHDEGGPTNFGISQRWLVSIGRRLNAAEIKALTIEQASSYYERFWWNAYSYSQFADQTVATKVFDMAVNMGPRQAHTLLQASLCALEKVVKTDGLIGPRTIGAANLVDPVKLVGYLCELQEKFYETIAANPKYPDRQRWLPTWRVRAAWPNVPPVPVNKN